MVHIIESYTNNPHIALASYIIKNIQGEIIKDYSDDNTKIIVLNTNTAKFMEVQYYNSSDECVDIKNLCDFNNEFEEQEN